MGRVDNEGVVPWVRYGDDNSAVMLADPIEFLNYSSIDIGRLAQMLKNMCHDNLVYGVVRPRPR